MSELPKTYDPKSVEDKLYKFWVDSGFFHAEVNPDKKPYTIVIPPPNAWPMCSWPVTFGGGITMVNGFLLRSIWVWK